MNVNCSTVYFHVYFVSIFFVCLYRNISFSFSLSILLCVAISFHLIWFITLNNIEIFPPTNLWSLLFFFCSLVLFCNISISEFSNLSFGMCVSVCEWECVRPKMNHLPSFFEVLSHFLWPHQRSATSEQHHMNLWNTIRSCWKYRYTYILRKCVE